MPLPILLVLSVITNLMQGLLASNLLNGRLEVKQQPIIKNFQTKYGDIFDCIQIHKQPAFNHPLLKNHSIEMKPNFNFSKWTRSDKANSSLLTKLLPKKLRCPKGTVPIKRVHNEDLAMEKLTPSLAITKFSDYSNSSEFNNARNQEQDGHHSASIALFMKISGVYGSLNVWGPEVTPSQSSAALMFVASDDGPVSNAIIAGWSVQPYVYQNKTWLYTYWTKDNGKTTGCYNSVCPGFVQISHEIPLGATIRPLSTYGGDQYYIKLSIYQNDDSKNWWLIFGGKPVGYWPSELFSTLNDGATRGGWGGEVYSPLSDPTPAMGSGHFPNEGYKKAAFIRGMKIRDMSDTPGSPSENQMKKVLTNPQCYDVIYGGDGGGDWGHYMFFGGPPNCKF